MKNVLTILTLLSSSLALAMQDFRDTNPSYYSPLYGRSNFIKNDSIFLKGLINKDLINKTLIRTLEDGPTDLMSALSLPESCALYFAQLLLIDGANVNLQDQKGETALMIAVRAGYSAVVSLLLWYKADKTLKNNAGETALDIALKTGQSVLAQKLA